MQQVMQTLESVTYYRMRLVKSLYDKLGTLAAPSIASFTACDKPRNLSAQCVCPETAGCCQCHQPSPFSYPRGGGLHACKGGYAYSLASIRFWRVYVIHT
jgi:hypothetical protein